MNMLSEEHKAISELLLPEIIELAEKYDNLVEPDRATRQIMLRCIGVSFSLGVAYNQTSSNNQWRKRLSDAFKIVAKGGK